ncbi:hypothetical protein ACWEOO_18955 [Kribbella sp. NPDC004138]|uniref:hypothetical protein n=1 Tax=Kribbella sp. NPDC051936 TaxID=3154946 RepID=UPI00342FD402
MTLPEREIPETQRAKQGDELAPEDITPVNRPVYMLVIGGLLLALLVGMVGWLVLVLNDKNMPEGLAVLLGSIGGALVGVLASTSKK